MSRVKNPEKTIDLILNVALNLFIENGYENTTIQDIINNLGGLSKGAIYHHFKSKEEIFVGVCQRIEDQNAYYFDKIRDDKNKTGLEKIKSMIKSSYENPNNDAMMAISSKLLRDAKFVNNQIIEIFEVIAPRYIQPMIEQGVSDGTIKTEYPKELAEVLILLLNLWISPMLMKATAAEVRKKLKLFQFMMRRIDIDLIEDNEIDLIVATTERMLILQ